MKAVIMHPVQAAELEAIVRALAEQDPIDAREHWTGGFNDFVCRFCREAADAEAELRHNEDCLWLRVRKALGMDVP